MSGPPLPNLVFTVTSGRTGTKYLSTLADALPGVAGRHEPEPNFVHVMRAAQSDPAVAERFLREQKLPAIRAEGVAHYVETSHLFCKGFLEPLARLGVPFGLVVLHRPPSEIAWSYIERRTVPARNEPGRRFLLGPEDPGVLPIADWQSLTHYQLCYWYALEMARRQRACADLWRREGRPVMELSSGMLADWEVFARLCATFGLPLGNREAARAEHARLSAIRHNPNRRPIGPRNPDLAVEEEEVWARIAAPWPGFRAAVLAGHPPAPAAPSAAPRPA